MRKWWQWFRRGGHVPNVEVRISPLELLGAPPMSGAQWERWIKDYLEVRGMDTARPMIRWDDPLSGHVVFKGYTLKGTKK